MDKKHVWIKGDDDVFYYCEIKSFEIYESYNLVEYDVYPIIGCFNKISITTHGDLNQPTICMMWFNNSRKYFGIACYDIDKLITNGK